MKNTREIKRRTKSIQNIQQITKAMEMVAANRLKKAEARVVSARPYAENITDILIHLKESTTEKTNFFNPKSEIKNILVLLITSDKGLCGAYNTNAIQSTIKFIKEHSRKNVKLQLFGKKGFLFFQRRPYTIDNYYTETVEQLGLSSLEATGNKVAEISKNLITDYEKGVYDEIYLFYTKFKTVMKSIPSSIRLLPIVSGDESSETSEEKKKFNDYILEPSSEEILTQLLPKCIESQIRQAIFESLTSEYAARRVAMIAASENAEDIIDDLTQAYNKARQESITKELLEVVSGSEAMVDR